MQQIFMAIEGMGFAFSIAMIRYFFNFSLIAARDCAII